MKKFPLIYWLPVLFYYCFITFLSATTPAVPAGATQFAHLDKIYHFCEYSFFGLVFARELYWQNVYFKFKFNWKYYFIGIVIALSALDEFHQYFTLNRGVEFLDALTDVLASLFGALLFSGLFLGFKETRDTASQLKAVREKDQLYFSFFLLLMLFFMVMTLNILGLGDTVNLFGLMCRGVEWSALGYVAHRSFFLLRHRGALRLQDWIFTVLILAIFLLVRKVAFAIMEIPADGAFFVLAVPAYCAGIVASAVKRIQHRLRLRLEFSPNYKRTTVQRVYYFYPVALSFSMLVGFSFLRVLPALSSLAFFIFGLLSLRALSWECWWHEKAQQRYFWLAGVFVAMLALFLNPELPQLFFNLLALALASAVYFLGLKFTAKNFCHDSHGKCND